MLWEYVWAFWEADSKLPVRIAPKLSAKHVNLPPFVALSVKLPTQFMSHSVAAGISTLCTFNAVPAEAQCTADFIEKVDQIFNCFNSGSRAIAA